jgi:hypothetical protein
LVLPFDSEGTTAGDASFCSDVEFEGEDDLFFCAGLVLVTPHDPAPAKAGVVLYAVSAMRTANGEYIHDDTRFRVRRAYGSRGALHRRAVEGNGADELRRRNGTRRHDDEHRDTRGLSKWERHRGHLAPLSGIEASGGRAIARSMLHDVATRRTAKEARGMIGREQWRVLLGMSCIDPNSGRVRDQNDAAPLRIRLRRTRERAMVVEVTSEKWCYIERLRWV